VLWRPRAALRTGIIRVAVHFGTLRFLPRGILAVPNLSTEGLPTLAEGYLARPERVIGMNRLYEKKTVDEHSFPCSRLCRSKRIKFLLWFGLIPHREARARVFAEWRLRPACCLRWRMAPITWEHVHTQAGSHQHGTDSFGRAVSKISEQKRAADESLAAQEKRLAQLLAESAEKEQALVKLRASLRALGNSFERGFRMR